MDPAYQRMKRFAEASNPYSGPQESQEDFIKRRNQGILSQTGGKTPYETSEARLRELEGRRAKEDADYAESKKGRQLDNLLTFIGGMGRGSFGNAGVQGINAVQRVERDQAAEDLRRKDLRDQQAMRLMEIRALNDQAQYAEATGNVKDAERFRQDAKKLENEFAFKQAELNKDVTTLGAGARAKDTEVAANERKLREESRQKQLEREKDLQVERIRAAARTTGRGELTDAQAAKIMKDAETAIAAREKNDSRLRSEYRNNPAARAAAVEAEANRLLGGYTSGSPSSKPDGGAPQGWGKPTVVKP